MSERGGLIKLAGICPRGLHDRSFASRAYVKSDVILSAVKDLRG
jgi:hypothetical protein